MLSIKTIKVVVQRMIEVWQTKNNFQEVANFYQDLYTKDVLVSQIKVNEKATLSTNKGQMSSGEVGNKQGSTAHISLTETTTSINTPLKKLASREAFDMNKAMEELDTIKMKMNDQKGKPNPSSISALKASPKVSSLITGLTRITANPQCRFG